MVAWDEGCLALTGILKPTVKEEGRSSGGKPVISRSVV